MHIYIHTYMCTQILRTVARSQRLATIDNIPTTAVGKNGRGKACTITGLSLSLSLSDSPSLSLTLSISLSLSLSLSFCGTLLFFQHASAP